MSKLSDFLPVTDTARGCEVNGSNLEPLTFGVSPRARGDALRDLAEQRFAQYLAELRQKMPAPGRRLERDLKALVRPFVPDASAAEYLGFMLMVALVQDTGINRVVPMFNSIVPSANKGRKFTPKGRGTSRLRKAVQRILKRRPKATAAEVWLALTSRPPKGITVCDNRVGKYVASDGEPDTGYRRFANIVSEEKHRP